MAVALVILKVRNADTYCACGEDGIVARLRDGIVVRCYCKECLAEFERKFGPQAIYGKSELRSV